MYRCRQCDYVKVVFKERDKIEYGNLYVKPLNNSNYVNMFIIVYCF